MTTSPLFRFCRPTFWLLAVTSVATISGCDTDTAAPAGDTPVEIVAESGVDQAIAAGETAEDPVRIRVIDAQGLGVPDVSVEITLVERPQGARSQETTRMTNADGVVDFKPLATTDAGTYVYKARVSDDDIGVEFKVNVTPGEASKIRVGQGEHHVAGAGELIDGELVAWSVDAHGNRSGSAPVEWTIESGSGTLLGPESEMRGGEARAGYRLSKDSDQAETVLATSPDLEGEATFTVEPGEVDIKSYGPETPLAGGQGEEIDIPLEVQLTDPGSGEPRSGITVAWDAVSGDVELASSMTESDHNGIARNFVRAGEEIGESRVRARAGGAEAAFPVFTTGDRGDIHTFSKPPANSGDEQSAVVGNELARPLVVRTLDRDGHPIQGVPIQWKVTSGGGQFVATDEGEATTVTNEQGLANIQWVVGTDFGAQTVEAVTQGFENEPIEFTAFATSRNEPDDIIPVGRTSLKGIIDSEVGEDQMAVSVVDSVRSPVEGAVVSWAVEEGDAVVARATSVSDEEGVATNELLVRDESSTVEARLARLPEKRLSFEVIGTGPPENLVVVSGDGQSETRRIEQEGTLAEELLLEDPFVVRVEDADGTSVKGAQVEWQVISGGGNVEPFSNETNFDGEIAAQRSVGEPGNARTRARLPGTPSTATFSADIVGIGDPEIQVLETPTLRPTEIRAVTVEVRNISSVSRSFRVTASSTSPDRVEIFEGGGTISLNAGASTTVSIGVRALAAATDGAAGIRIQAIDTEDNGVRSTVTPTVSVETDPDS